MSMSQSRLIKPAKLVIIAAMATLAVAVAGCGSSGSSAATTSGQSLKPVSIALDWTPNADNEGVFAAQHLGYFKAAGLHVTIVPYGQTAPDTLVASGRTDFAITATEGDALADFAQGMPVTSVMAVLERDPTVLVYAASTKGATSPAYFCGKINGGPGDPSEYAEVQTMLDTAAGHRCSYKNLVLGTAASQAIAAKRIDFSILFFSDVIEAKAQGINLATFSPQNYGMPQNYGPLVLGNNSFLKSNPAAAKAFIGALAKGYAYIAKNPVKGAQILYEMNPSAVNKNAAITETVAEAKSYLLDPQGRIGYQSTTTWQTYSHWMIQHRLLKNSSGQPVSSLNVIHHFTNQYVTG